MKIQPKMLFKELNTIPMLLFLPSFVYANTLFSSYFIPTNPIAL
jgi:hypothetical protein